MLLRLAYGLVCLAGMMNASNLYRTSDSNTATLLDINENSSPPSSSSNLEPLIQYQFLRQDCGVGRFPDSASGKYLGNLTTRDDPQLCFTYRNGIDYPASAENDISLLQSQLIETTNVTYDFWVQVNTSKSHVGHTQSLMLIDGSGKDAENECSYSFEILAERTSLTTMGIYVTACIDDDPIIFTETILNFAEDDSSQISDLSNFHHIFMMVSYNEFSFSGREFHEVFIQTYIDGVLDEETGTSFYVYRGEPAMPSTWPASDTFTLLRSSQDPIEDPPFSVRLIMFSLYDGGFTKAEINEIYTRGVANTIPTAFSGTHVVQQSGEAGDHSNDPAFYRQPIPSNELSVVYLETDDFDDTVVSPNYEPGIHALVGILRFPNASDCLLYDFNGTQLPYNKSSSSSPSSSPGSAVSNVETFYTHVRFDQDTRRNSLAVRIRPADNLVSTDTTDIVCSFAYVAIDGETQQPSDNVGVASIIVTRVDRPPIAADGHAIVSFDELVEITLIGYDEDSVITKARIHSLPVYGELYAVDGNGKVSNSLYEYGTESCISRSNCSITIPSYPAKIAYIYNTKDIPAHHLAADQSHDNFTFSLVDVEGRFSLPAVQNFTIVVSLRGEAAGPSGPGSANTQRTEPLAIEGTYSPITLYGYDDSRFQRNLTVRIESLPLRGGLYTLNMTGSSTDISSVLDAANAQDMSNFSYVELKIGDTLLQYIDPDAYSEGIKIFYLGEEGFFTYPAFTWNGSSLPENLVTLDSFSFTVILYDNGPVLNGPESDEILQTVTIRNVNQPTYVNYTHQAPYTDGNIEIYAFSYAYDNKYATSLSLDGFSIIDIDHDVDVVKVEVSASTGYFTLNENFIDDLDFNSQRYCKSNAYWHCEGSGYSDHHAVFVATPSAALKALNGLHYQNPHKNVVDMLKVTIYDGVGDGCLDQTQLNTLSIRTECFVDSTNVTIFVKEYAEVMSDASLSYANLKPEQKPLVLLALVATVLLLLRYRYILSKEKKESKQKDNTPITFENLEINMDVGARDSLIEMEDAKFQSETNAGNLSQSANTITVEPKPRDGDCKLRHEIGASGSTHNDHNAEDDDDDDDRRGGGGDGDDDDDDDEGDDDSCDTGIHSSINPMYQPRDPERTSGTHQSTVKNTSQKPLQGGLQRSHSEHIAQIGRRNTADSLHNASLGSMRSCISNSSLHLSMETQRDGRDDEEGSCQLSQRRASARVEHTAQTEMKSESQIDDGDKRKNRESETLEPNSPRNTNESTNKEENQKVFVKQKDKMVVMKSEIVENLPTGWTAHRHRTGKMYYYNRETGKSTWSKPVD